MKLYTFTARKGMEDRIFVKLAALAVILCAVVAPSARATDVVVAAGGTQPELQAAVDELGGPGVILVPPGTWEFNPEGTDETTRTVVIPYSHVTLLGAGTGKTTLQRSTGGDQERHEFILFQSPSETEGLEWIRVSGLNILGNSATEYSEWGVIMENVSSVRVDHCRFEDLGHSGVQMRNASSGVIDHCTFVDIYKPLIANLGYGVAVQGDSTITGTPFGSELAAYIEDSDFTGCRHAVASNLGARYVFRHNHVARCGTPNGIQAIDAHGHEHPALPTTCGTEWIDAYENVVGNPAAGADAFAVLIRGGMGLVWNNAFSGYDVGIMLWERTDQETGPVYIWGNTLPGGTMIAEDGGSPTYRTSRPSGYSPYPYPHPLVVDMVAVAGPDMNAMIPDGLPAADVYVDATSSRVEDPHAIVSATWYLDASVVSTCMRDIIPVPEGTHLLLLELERDDGLLEYDLAVVESNPEAPLESSATWPGVWFVPLVGSGTVSFTLTPAQEGMNGYAALAGRRVVNDHEDSAVIVRANTDGFFDARSGDAYQSDASIPYVAGTSYRIELSVDVTAQTYGVTVDGRVLATGYAFRRDDSSLWQLTAWDAAGSLSVEDITVEGDLAVPDPECLDHGEPDPEEPWLEPASDGTEPTWDASGDTVLDHDGEPSSIGSSGGCGCALAGA